MIFKLIYWVNIIFLFYKKYILSGTSDCHTANKIYSTCLQIQYFLLYFIKLIETKLNEYCFFFGTPAARGGSGTSIKSTLAPSSLGIA